MGITIAAAGITLAGVGTASWATVISVVLTVASLAYSFLASEDDPSRKASTSPDSPGLKVNTCSTQEYIRVAYGEQRLGGNDVYRELTGYSDKILWIVQVLSEDECEGLVQDGEGNDQWWVDDVLNDGASRGIPDLTECYFHAGTGSQNVDSNLNAAVPEWTDCLRYTCYVVWRLRYSTAWWQGMPKRSLLLEGRKLFDYRTSTTAYSQNAPLALYDYLTSARYGMGKDITSANIDITSWTAAANYFDSKGWTFNYTLTKNESAEDVVNIMLSHFRGKLTWYDGKLYLYYADLDEESSCMTIEDKHIVQKGDGSAALSISQPSRFKKPDGLSIKIIDPDKQYSVDDLIIGDEDGVLKELPLLGATKDQAYELGHYFLERKRLDRVITGTFRGDCIKLEPHDLITLNSTALGISSQLMRVVKATIMDVLTVELVLQYEDESLYDLTLNLNEESVYSCNLPDPTEEPPSITNVSLTEEQYDFRGKVYTRLKIEFDPPTAYDWYKDVEVWISIDGEVTWEHYFNTTSDFELPMVEEGIGYTIRLKVVNDAGMKQEDNNDYKLYHLVEGYTDAPESLASIEYALSDNGILHLYTGAVDDPEVEKYVFRLGASFASGLPMGALRSPNLVLGRVKPGEHTFFVNTYGTNGTYGDSPVSTDITVADPPVGYSVVATETDDFDESSAVHSNTEAITYDAQNYLSRISYQDVLVNWVDENDDNILDENGDAILFNDEEFTSLTGTYTSPIWDRGSIDTFLVACLCNIVLTGAGTLWDDKIIEGSTLWEDLDPDQDKKWSQLFDLAAGGRVTIQLLYGDVSPPTSTADRLEILAVEVEGRYFQIKIIIVDDSPEVHTIVQNLTVKFYQPT